MTLNIPTGYYEVAFEHSISGSLRTAVCTWGVHYTGSNVTADADDVRLAWKNRILSFMTTNYTLIETRFRDAVGTAIVIPGSDAGTNSATAATPNMAFLVKKLTGLGGRKNHGRLYLPGVEESVVDPTGVVDSSVVSALTTGFVNFVNDMAASNFFSVLLHNGTTAPTPITAVQAESLAATQRRRMRK